MSDHPSFDTMEIKQKKEQYTQEIRKSKIDSILNAKRKRISKTPSANSGSKIQEEIKPLNNRLINLNHLTKRERMQIAGDNIISSINQKNEEMLLLSLQDLRVCVSEDESIPVDEFISLDLKQTLVDLFFQCSCNVDILRELLWITMNIFSAPYAKISGLYSNELVRALISCLSHMNIEIIESVNNIIYNHKASYLLWILGSTDVK